MKPSRDVDCPCGSGREFQKCCGKAIAPTGSIEWPRDLADQWPADVVAILRDPNGKNVIFKTGFLVNQLRRDAPRIAASFDRFCGSDIATMDRYSSECVALVYTGLEKTEGTDEDWRIACGHLLLNALSTWLAAADLLRDGFILQPGILIRNLLETLTAVLCILLETKHWDAFKRDDLRPENHLSTANRVLPIFGQLYGIFSGTFAHVRKLYSQLHPIIEYRSRDYEPLDANIGFLRMTLWLTCVVAEVIFYDVSRARYWRSLGHGFYEYVHTDAGREMERELLGDYAERITDVERAEGQANLENPR